MKTALFNPFKFIAGNKALLLGFSGMLITALVCLFGKFHQDGIIDIHKGIETPRYFYFIEPLIDWLCFILTIYLFGRSLSVSAVRFIDIAGTGALARYPMFLVAILSIVLYSIVPTSDPQELATVIMSNPLLMAKVILLSLLMIPFIIWTVALMYNAYTVSANLKGAKAIWSFVASFIIAEIFSKTVIISIIKLY